jgi:predicted DNA binding CopG/RHH family protein
MNYKIIIEKKEPNQNFEAEYKQWQDDQRYSMNRNYEPIAPQRENVTNALIIELTEEQFKAIKAEVFRVFE